MLDPTTHPYEVWVHGHFDSRFRSLEGALDTAVARGGEIRGKVVLEPISRGECQKMYIERNGHRRSDVTQIRYTATGDD